MKEFDFVEYYNNVNQDIEFARNIVREIEEFKQIGFHYKDEQKEFKQDEHDFNCDRLNVVLDQIKIKIEFALELLQLDKLQEKFEAEFKKYNKLYELEYIGFIGIFISPVLWTLDKYLNAITSHVKIENKQNLEDNKSVLLLEQILKGTAKLLSDRGIEPTNEKVVRNEIYKTLIHVFPDTVREIPIAKVSKTYKPDIGVKRLKIAIEYKFVDSETEAKTAIGGIFEDIQGYEGSNDWTNFYAVIYMTDNYLTPFQIEEEFKLSKVPYNWKPIIVFGKGGRKKKTNQNGKK